MTSIDLYHLKVQCHRHGVVGVGQAIESDVVGFGRHTSGRFTLPDGPPITASEMGPVLRSVTDSFYPIPLMGPMPKCPTCRGELFIDSERTHGLVDGEFKAVGDQRWHERLHQARLDQMKPDVDLVVTPEEFDEIKAKHGEDVTHLWGAPLVVVEEVVDFNPKKPFPIRRPPAHPKGFL